MPQIFDNIEKHLLSALTEAMGLSERADFCVGYFNLRGWKQVSSLADKWTGGEGHCCRLLVGMQQMPHDQLKLALSPVKGEQEIDQAGAIVLKRKLAQEFRDQLTVGIPTNEDEAGLRRLASQIAAQKVVVKLFLRHALHAKLYLLFRQDPLNPKIGYLGSSNLTLAGLSKQGELNVDVFLHAIEKGLPLPIGTQDMGLLDTWANDQDSDLWDAAADDDNNGSPADCTTPRQPLTEKDVHRRAAGVYSTYSSQFRRRFKWLRPELFDSTLADDLRKDGKALMDVLERAGIWNSERDTKLQALLTLLTTQHPQDKVLVFSQFADTVDYLEGQLKARGLDSVAAVTGNTDNPTAVAYRFSPVSNERRDQIDPANELRVVLTTDVLSEGQNLQDCSIVVNYDLPWAIIRLIQRAGRVDRIGQQSDRILCYSFLPADGVEQIIHLRARVKQRLRENAEVVGADETFFEGEKDDLPLLNLYNEKAGILDGDEDTEVDLASYAYQIWKNAIDQDSEIEKIVPAMPNVVYSTKGYQPTPEWPEGALVYIRTAEGNDALAWIDTQGNSVTESQFTILKAAECTPGTPALARAEDHHELVAKGIKLIVETEKSVGGQLGRPSGARFRTYERLKRFAE